MKERPAAFDDSDIRQAIRAMLPQYGTQRALADALRVSDVHLCNVLKGKSAPGIALAGAVGFERAWVLKP